MQDVVGLSLYISGNVRADTGNGHHVYEKLVMADVKTDFIIISFFMPLPYFHKIMTL